jgi:hypothetical protein
MAKVIVITYKEPTAENGRDVICYLRAEVAQGEISQLTRWGLEPESRRKVWKKDYGLPLDAPKGWEPA